MTSTTNDCKNYSTYWSVSISMWVIVSELLLFAFGQHIQLKYLQIKSKYNDSKVKSLTTDNWTQIQCGKRLLVTLSLPVEISGNTACHQSFHDCTNGFIDSTTTTQSKITNLKKPKASIILCASPVKVRYCEIRLTFLCHLPLPLSGSHAADYFLSK